MCEDDERNDTLRIPAELLEELRRRAAAENMTLHQYVNEILRDYLEREEDPTGE